MSTPRSVRLALDWLKFVDFGGAVIVTLAIGIILGELAAEDLSRISRISSIIATGACIVFSVTTLYFIKFDRRKHHNFLLLGTLAILTVANATRMYGFLPTFVHEILFSLSSLFVACLLQVNAAQGRLHAKDHP